MTLIISSISEAKVSIKDCPNYVREVGKCDPFIRILTDAEEYSVILKSDYVITKAYYKDRYVFVIIQRGSLVGEVRVGEFEGIKKVTLKQGGELDVVYSKVIVKEITWKEKVTYFGGGFLGGLLAGLFFIIKLLPLLI
jgi:hypothetical protein